MNLGPIQSSSVNANVPDSEPQVREAHHQRPEPVADPPKPVVEPSTIPVPPIEDDQVKLQWDPSVHLRIYQFVNQSGTLILQVPSEEVLNLARGIRDSLQKESLARSQETAQQTQALEAGAPEGKNDGS